MKPSILISNRSVLIQTSKLQVYYGSEEVDPLTQNWCMVIKKNNKEVARYTNEVLLDIAQGESIKDIVIAGLTLYLGR